MGGRETAKRSSGLFWRRIRGVFAPRKRITARAHGNDVIPRGNVTSVLRAPRDTNEAQPRVWRYRCDARAFMCMWTQRVQCDRDIFTVRHPVLCVVRPTTSTWRQTQSYSGPWRDGSTPILRSPDETWVDRSWMRFRGTVFAWKIVSGYIGRFWKLGQGNLYRTFLKRDGIEKSYRWYFIQNVFEYIILFNVSNLLNIFAFYLRIIMWYFS